jgi:hypothetical protein
VSFLRAELAERMRIWREPAAWGLLLLLGLWLIWQGYSRLAPLSFAAGLIFAATGLGLLLPSVRRVRLRVEALGEGVVVIDEWRIAYFGPRGGGFIDLPSIVRVEIVTRPHVPPDSAHAWVLSADDGTRLVVPLGAEGAERLLDVLSPLPGIDFDAGANAVATRQPGHVTLWSRTG